jgi:hypothetical protein
MGNILLVCLIAEDKEFMKSEDGIPDNYQEASIENLS